MLLAKYPSSQIPAPQFFAPFSDLGSGAASLVLSAGSGSATFSRASQAAARLSTGLWKLDVASGTARGHYLPNLVYGGVFIEDAATQLVTPAASVRDLTNVAWAKTANMLAAKTSTGVDGAANSCTRLTANGAGNQTILQTLAAASTQRTLSFFIKRITGSGNIDITTDNGGTWTTLTGIGGVSFSQLSITTTVLNPIFGLRIVTNGDAIDVDCAQYEAGGMPTSPIPAAGTRSADSLSYTAANLNATVGTMFCQMYVEWLVNASGGSNCVAGVDSAQLGGFGGSGPDSSFMSDGVQFANQTSIDNCSSNIRKRASNWKATGSIMGTTGAGFPAATNTFAGSMGSGGALYVGSLSGANTFLNGTVLNLKTWNTFLDVAKLTA